MRSTTGARSRDGPIYRNSRTSVASVTDGLSNTIFLGEHSAVLSDKTWVGVRPRCGRLPDPEFAFSFCDVAATQVLVHSGPNPWEDPPAGPPAQLAALQVLPDVCRAPRRLQRHDGRRQRPLRQHEHQPAHMAGPRRPAPAARSSARTSTDARGHDSDATGLHSDRQSSGGLRRPLLLSSRLLVGARRAAADRRRSAARIASSSSRSPPPSRPGTPRGSTRMPGSSTEARRGQVLGRRVRDLQGDPRQGEGR